MTQADRRLSGERLGFRQQNDLTSTTSFDEGLPPERYFLDSSEEIVGESGFGSLGIAGEFEDPVGSGSGPVSDKREKSGVCGN